jgi:ATP-dependent exoDNAse (exonuclease V) beta subunit
VEYLKLALRHPTYYRRILAVTFTNKATNEMKARIIQFLFDLKDNKADPELINTLCDTLHLTSVQLSDRAKATLRTLLHAYSYFSVSTIDSFFQKVINAFSKDLGIQGGYNLEFEINKVKDEIIDKLFVELDQKPALKKWMVQFAMTKIKSNKSWDIRYDIRELAGQIFIENFSNYYDALSEKISDTSHLSKVLTEIGRESEKIKHQIKILGLEGLDFIHDHGLEATDFFQGMRGPAGLFHKMANNQSINISNKYINDVLTDMDKWYSSKSKKLDLILKALEDGLHNLYKNAFESYKNEIIRYNTYTETLKYFYNLGIVSNLIEGLKEYRDENEVILISDLSHLLKIVIGENDAPFIYERVGSFYNHFLIDEFQDTSRFQWFNFLPLILNSLSSGQFNMIVGDVKQSIYRWRGGDWEILQKGVGKDIGSHYVNSENLSENWRSLKNIIFFNNTLFKSLSRSFKDKFLEEINSILYPALLSGIPPLDERFEAAYHDVSQRLPEKRSLEYNGTVEIKFIENSDEEPGDVTWKDKVLPELVSRVQTIQDHGYSPKDIAILVRTKEEGRKIANYLLDFKNREGFDSKYKFDVISSESLFLKSSPAINVIIYFIKLIINQNDLIAAANFYYWLSVLKVKERETDYGNIFQKIQDVVLLVELNEELLNIPGNIEFKKYRSVPLIDLIEEISILVHLEDHPEESAYLLGLQNVILEYIVNKGKDLNVFIQWWFEEGQTKSIKPSLEQNAINILTIHQSKGLQYKHVMIPYCSWGVDHGSNKENIIWVESDFPVLDQIRYYPVRYSKQLGASYFVEAYLSEKSLAYMDNLNLLYVAMTRAEEGLFVFGELPKDPGRTKTVGDMILQFFRQNSEHERSLDPEFSDFTRFWNNEESRFYLGNMEKAPEQEDTKSMYTLDDYQKGGWHDKISIRKQADIFSHDDSEAPGERINYGILLHDILSRIYTIDQAEAVLTAEVRSGNISAGDKKQLALMLANLWKVEKIKNWFAGGWTVKTEVPVLPEKGQIRRLDRVMIKGKNAIVVDYKTGSKRYSDINQVKDYMNILRKMRYKSVEGYVLYLGDRELIAV